MVIFLLDVNENYDILYCEQVVFSLQRIGKIFAKSYY